MTEQEKLINVDLYGDGIACVDGGTKKTKMYGRVYSEAKDSERYHKLSYPNNTYIAKIGDGAFLAPPYVRIERGPDSRLFCRQYQSNLHLPSACYAWWRD